MDMTAHGARRVLKRTLMDPNAVLAILEEGRAIVLGKEKGTTFLLFYSPSDKTAKIALVGESVGVSSLGKNLISVWETYFKLPPGITPPDKKLVEEAYLMWARQRETLEAEVEVLYEGTAVFNLYLPLSLWRAQAEFSTVFELSERLRPLAAAVEEIRLAHRLKGPVGYRIWCIDPVTREVLYRHDLAHHNLLSYLKNR